MPAKETIWLPGLLWHSCIGTRYSPMLKLIFLSVLFLPIALKAQLTIGGNVLESQTSIPLSGAGVLEEISGKGTIVSENGTFSLSGIRPGPVKLRVSLVGYTSFILSTEISKDTIIQFLLEPGNTVTEEVVVTATRFPEQGPGSFTTITRAEITAANFGQDLPFLLNQTPNTIVSSDAGTGIGYTGIRIRGSDPTRINVTINGIPLNDAESQAVYWVNLPDFASSVQSVQVQRGIGSSTNGASAFGATLNLQTLNISREAYAEVNTSAGSFNTLKNTVQAGTGILKKHFAFETRLSRVVSDGYIDRAFSELKSFYASGAYLGDKTILKFNVFSGKERTYQAWYGVPEDSIETNPTYNPVSYENETDNYQQDHYQLILAQALEKGWTLNAALHYTRGKGYYEQFRADDAFATYGLEPVAINTDTFLSTDIIRRLWLDNHFYGGVWSVQYQEKSKIDFSIGGGLNRYEGTHFGEIIWMKTAGNTPSGYKYYEDIGVKTDFNLYYKLFCTFAPGLTAYGDIQFRTIGYSFLGYNRKLENVQQDVLLNFFNPKAGITWQITDAAQGYASYAMGHREPIRDDFTQSSPDSRPKPEVMQDVEVGYRFKKKKIQFDLNYYLMYYRDQLVLTGAINDVGAYIRTNVAKSYRTGIEFNGGWQMHPRLLFQANVSLNRNKLLDYVDKIDNYDTGLPEETMFKESDIAFSPAIVGGGTLQFKVYKSLELSWILKAAGKQYLDNTESEARSLDGFQVHSIRMAWTLFPKFCRQINVSVQVNNLFNEVYSPNGYTYGWIENGKRTDFNFLFPQAGANVLGMVNFRF